VELWTWARLVRTAKYMVFSGNVIAKGFGN